MLDIWIGSLRAGDPFALQKPIVFHHGRLARIAKTRMEPRLRAKLDPEDLLQRVYADAAQRIGSLDFPDAESFFAWLRKLLESKLKDARRYFQAAARDAAREVEAPAAPSEFGRLLAKAAAEVPTPSRIVSRRESEAQLHAALAGLSADHRHVLDLRYLKARSLAEVALTMGRSVPAVQMLLLRALKALRASLRSLSGPTP